MNDALEITLNNAGLLGLEFAWATYTNSSLKSITVYRLRLCTPGNRLLALVRALPLLFPHFLTANHDGNKLPVNKLESTKALLTRWRHNNNKQLYRCRMCDCTLTSLASPHCILLAGQESRPLLYTGLRFFLFLGICPRIIITRHERGEERKGILN